MALVLVFCMPVGCRSGGSAGDPPQHKGMTSVGESSANGDTAANSESSVNVDSPMIDATETDAETAVTDESALPFYTLECPDSVVLGIYSWNDRIVLYTYNEGKYNIVCMDADSGEVLARTQDGYDYHVWLDFSAPVTPENEQACFAEFTESEAQTGGDTIFDSVIQTEKNILIEDDIFNSDSPAEENGQGRQLSDVPLPDQPQIAGNAPVQAPNPAAPQTADDAPALLQPHKTQLRIYDPQTQSFIWLDDALNAIKSWTMPDAVTSNPLMDSDNAHVYYVNSDGDVLRLEVATGQSTEAGNRS